jgi:hypothetical protein
VASHVRALSSSWACKYTPLGPEEDEEESEFESEDDEELSDEESERVVEGITDLLARADAVLNDQGSRASEDSPINKRIKLDSQTEFEQLFGNE